MLRFLLTSQILCLFASVYCQNINQQDESMLGNKTYLYTKYDIQHIKLSETMYVNSEIKYTNYFSREGDTISMYDWAIGVTAIKIIREKILNNFIVNDLTYARGCASLLLLIDCEKNIFEIRIMRGITDNFNNELLRVVDKIEKDLIFICSDNCKTYVVTPFAIRLNE